MIHIDNTVALKQLQDANAELLTCTSAQRYKNKSLAKDRRFHSWILTLVNQLLELQAVWHYLLLIALTFGLVSQNGDHTITLLLLHGVVGVYESVRFVTQAVHILNLPYYAISIVWSILIAILIHLNVLYMRETDLIYIDTWKLRQ